MKKVIYFVFLLIFLSCDERSEDSEAKKAIETVDEDRLLKNLEKSTLESVKNEFQKKGYSYKVNKITLVHKRGNEYSGILNITAYDQETTMLIEVVCDGTNMIWQIKEH